MIAIKWIENLRDSNILDRCAKVGNWLIKVTVAENEFVSSDTLSFLSQDYDTMVRYAVAQSKKTSQDDLDKLSKDEQWIVRFGVLKNPNTRNKTRELLQKDPILQGR